MRTIAILPVKSFGAAKQRLSGMLGGGARSALAQAMFSDVLASLRHSQSLDAIAVVTADRQADSAASRHGAIALRDDGVRDLHAAFAEREAQQAPETTRGPGEGTCCHVATRS